MVMPRSRSSSIESSTCAPISRADSPPVRSIRRSASVDLPWSMCAMMEKLRIWSMQPGKNKGHVPVPFCNAAILLHSGEPGIHGVGVEVVVAKLPLAVEHDRHLVAPLFLEARIAVDVDHLDVEVVAGLDLLQARQHLLAQVAV